jgi:hydrogenase expression/formation protein HypC
MCLTIPMKIVAIDRFIAHCEAKGVKREVSLFMLQSDQLAVGDFVTVHAGYAVQKVTSQEAHSIWALFDQVLGTADVPLMAEDEHS